MDTVELNGTVESEIFRNKDSGFTVFSLLLQDEEVDLVCVGNIPAVAEGEYVKVRGSYVVHAVYGKQLKVDYLERTLPESELGIERYLASGAIKGIRARLAAKIVAKFGKDTLNVLEEHPELLAQIRGINLAKAQQISAEFHEQNEMRRSVMYLQSQGIGYTQAMKLYKRYHEATVDVVKENPYVLVDEIDGIGFKIADEIAIKMGLPTDSPYRIGCGIRYVLSSASQDGHIYLPKERLMAEAAGLLSVDGLLIENSLSLLQIERRVILEETDGQTAVYLNMFFYAEAVVAKKLVELDCNSADIFNGIDADSIQTGIVLAEKQKTAVASALTHGVLVITGGPGTGKTTTIRTIISLMKRARARIELAAPTGRAAKRMSEATGMEARTIHRLLEISFDDKSVSEQSHSQYFGRNADNPLDADVVIIDESSMVDIFLMSGLMKALVPGTRLILVGDVDQLPSVGPGNVLKDIIDSGCVRVVRLSEVFRQAEESAIVMNAHRINRGEYPVLNERDKDFFFVKREQPETVIDTMLELITKRLPRYLGCGLYDIQVLSPMRKSALGVTNLNRVLQQYLNPPSPKKPEKESHGVIFRQGDKVMQIKNNYNAEWRSYDENGDLQDEGEGVFNGDIGIIRSIDDDRETVSVLFDDNRLVEYEYERLDELEPAYAITIHKSQGSEYKAVIMPLHSGPPMLMSRNLLYTGVTRARELAVIVGITHTLYGMVDNNRPVSRYTSLAQRLQKMERFMTGTARHDNTVYSATEAQC